MSRSEPFRVLVLSVVKHDYVARGVASHPRFELVVVADDANQPDWIHHRNEAFAREHGIPYLRNIEKAIAEHNVQIAVVSSEAERHCELSVRAASAGLHVIQDKPMSNSISECDRVVQAVEQNNVKFLMWNRNLLPALVQAKEVIDRGDIGVPYAIHVDFYFAKDAGPPRGSRGPDDPPLDWLESLKTAHATGADGGVGNAPMGELSIEGCYPLAYIAMLCHANVRRVFARTTAHFHQLCVDNDVEELAAVTLEFDRELVGSLAIGRIGNASHPDIGEIKLHILGSNGALVVSEARPEISIYYRNQPASEFSSHRLLASDNDYLLADDFALAIDTDGQT
ncbi:MAG TPA: Gfo/Idh/MocA family oxidoreductase, partial [Fuerstia sp.]|nr:Gfo/Idh/MocA family oxidoreductase [Fuerstiella sp.]